MKTTTLFLILLLAGFQAAAFTPESGHYWDPDEPGTGYTIEIQDNQVFASLYVYDDDGYPVWYTVQAALVGNSSFTGRLVYSEGGQCLGCYWSKNNSQYSGYGNVHVEFLTETKAKFTVLGVTKTIERFNFFLGDELQKMRGEWQVVIDASQYTNVNEYPYFSDVMIFEQVEVYKGDDLVTGCRSESTVYYHYCTTQALQNNDVAALYDYGNDELVAVMRDDADYYLAYYLKTGTDQFDGEAFSYRVGSQPNLNLDGFLARGFRTASKTFVDDGVGPSSAGELPNNNKALQKEVNSVGLGQFLPQRIAQNKAGTNQVSRISDKDSQTQARILATIKKLEQQLQD